MPTNIDKLKQLLENIRTIGFWSRLFGWRRVKDQVVDAATDLERLVTIHENEERRVFTVEQANGDLTKGLNRANEDLVRKQAEVDKLTLNAAGYVTTLLSLNTDLSSVRATLKSEQEKNTGLSNRLDLLSQKNDQLALDVQHLSDRESANIQAIGDLTHRKNELDIELAAFKKDLAKTRDDLSNARDAATQLLNQEQNRQKQHDEQMTTLKQFQDKVQADRDQEIHDRHAAEIARLEKMKDTWVHHQAKVKQEIKMICGRHTIDYVEKVPFRGDPDNTVSICGEFIVFCKFLSKVTRLF